MGWSAVLNMLHNKKISKLKKTELAMGFVKINNTVFSGTSGFH